MEMRLLEANSRWTRNTFVYYGFSNSPLTEQVCKSVKIVTCVFVRNWAGKPIILPMVSCCSHHSVHGNVKIVLSVAII